MSIWRRFGEEIARTEDEMLAGDARLERVRGRFLETASGFALGTTGRAGNGRRAVAWGLAAAAAVAIVVTTAVVTWRGAAPIAATVDDDGRPLHAGEWIAAPSSAERRIDFTDGSSISLAPRSGARLVSLSKNGARVSLERGTAQVAVHKRTDARWQVDVGPYTVVVRGTRFVVAWDPTSQLFTLALEEGRVFVRGPLLPEGRTIGVDETLRASVAEGRLEILAGGAEAASRTEAPGPTTGAAPPSAPSGADADEITTADPTCAQTSGAARTSAPRVASTAAAAPEPESFGELARNGSYAAAVEAAERQGLDAVLAGAKAADLLLLGDAARLSRRYDIADRSYLAVRAKHPGAPESVSAAFALGRLAFDHQHLYVKAAQWLDVYLSEGGDNAALAREALGRLMEAMQRAGDPDGAKSAASRYLASYPSGPHAAVARRILSAGDEPAPSAP